MMEGGGLSLLRNKALGASKRIKISRACDECRKRKVKCDGVQPCGRCRKSNAECVFAKLPPKRGPPKQYMENLENRLQRVEKALKSMTAPVRRVFEEALAAEKHKQSLELNNIPMIPEVVPFNSNKKSVSYSAPYTTDMSHIDRFSINEIGQAIYVNDIKVRSDRIPNEQQQKQYYVNDTQSDISDSSTSFFQQQIPLMNNSSHQIEIPIPDQLSSRPLVSEVQPLIELYFDHVHKYVPMIHKPSFLKQMNSSTSPPSRLLLYTMCAVASKWTHTQNEQPPGYIHYQRAIEILDEFLDVPRVSTIQALILIIKYQEYYQRIGYFHRTNFYLNIACHMCQDLGLNELENDNVEIETKRRTFWIVFVYDLLSNLESGNEPFFDIKKCKTNFPLVTNEEGPALEELIINQNIFIQLGKVLSEVYIYSRRILKRQQIQQLNQKSIEQTIEEQTKLFSLHTHLENFLYEIPPTLIYPPTQDVENYPVEKQCISDPFIGFLHMTYHFTIILLHGNYISIPPPKTEYNFIHYNHRKLCSSSASNITMIVESLYERYPTFIFHYPIRGIQHTIYCLAMAATIHKYEMLNGMNDIIRDIAKKQYLISIEIIQHLSNESPLVELSNYFNQPIQQQDYSSFTVSDPIIIDNNFTLGSSWSNTNWNPNNFYYPLYPSFDSTNTTPRIRRHTVSSQQPYYSMESTSSNKKPSDSFDPNLNLDMMVIHAQQQEEQDTMMMDNHHYDPTSGMSQLFLTDDQQQQQQQQITWDGSIISDTSRSEGHVLK